MTMDRNPAEDRWLHDDGVGSLAQEREAARLRSVGLPAWSLMPEQRAFLDAIDLERRPGWWYLADRLVAEIGVDRIAPCSPRLLYGNGIGRADVEDLIRLGILRRKQLPSGAWLCQQTPFLKSFAMALWSRRPAIVAHDKPRMEAEAACLADVEGYA